MALPSCRRCGKQDPQRMYGLMALWFGPLVDMKADLGYFHLCPACHDEFVAPELERIHNRILELHPAAARALDEMEMSAAEAYAEDRDTGAAEPTEPAAPVDPDEAGAEEEADDPAAG